MSLECNLQALEKVPAAMDADTMAMSSCIASQPSQEAAVD